MLGYALALVIGLALGLLGGGGAILTVPALVYAMGVSVKQAVPTSLVVVGLTSLVGATRHARAGTLNLRAALAFGPPAMLGALVGSRAALRVTSELQLLVFGVILLAAAGMMLRPVRGQGEASRPRSPLPLIGVLGAGVGFLTGFIGVGGGFMYVPALVLLGGLEMKQAVGTSLALIALSSATGVVSYLGRVPIDWAMVVPFTALAFVGVGIGSALVPKVPQAALRRGFAIFMVLMGLMVLLRR